MAMRPLCWNIFQRSEAYDRELAITWLRYLNLQSSVVWFTTGARLAGRARTLRFGRRSSRAEYCGRRGKQDVQCLVKWITTHHMYVSSPCVVTSVDIVREFFEYNLSQKGVMYDKRSGSCRTNPSHSEVFGQSEKPILVVWQAVDNLCQKEAVCNKSCEKRQAPLGTLKLSQVPLVLAVRYLSEYYSIEWETSSSTCQWS